MDVSSKKMKIHTKPHRYLTMAGQDRLCRSYPCPGSIAMIAFRHPSRFWASFGSSSCCFRSLRTRSIHLSLGLPRDLPPSSLLHVLLRSFRLFSSHGQTTKGVSGRHAVIGLTIASLLNFSFLIRSFLVSPPLFYCLASLLLLLSVPSCFRTRAAFVGCIFDIGGHEKEVDSRTGT